MKRPYIKSKTMRVIAVLTASANLLTACGPGFTANKAAFERPPTTSDLFEAETESDLEAFKQNKAPSAPFLESAEARRAFEEDITGSPRSQSDDQLAEVLETQHQEIVNDKDSTAAGTDDADDAMPVAPVPSDRAQTHKEYLDAKAAGVNSKTESAAPGAKSVSASGSNREGQAPVPRAGPVSGAATVATVAQLKPTDSADVSPSSTIPSVPADFRKQKIVSGNVMAPASSAATSATSSATTPTSTSTMPANPPLPPVQENKENWQRIQQGPSGTVSEQRAARLAARRASNPNAVAANAAAESRRDKVIQQISHNICDVVNVKSSVPEDLAYLYFDKKALPTKLPADTLQSQSGNAKKNMFVCLLLPHAIRMDAQVYSQRLEIIRLQGRSRKGTITDEDNKWLSDLKRAYRLADSGSFSELLARVDVVPLPLILTQAAFESEWGTSKGARITNNLFGMHSVDHKNCMPGFDTGGKSCLRNFRSVTEGISMYIRLLDAGTYFGKFREIRAEMRANGTHLDSVKLLAGMGSYSERGGAYISEVVGIMNGANKIGKYELDEQKIRQAAANDGRPNVNAGK